jgi:hypothetical protein
VGASTLGQIEARYRPRRLHRFSEYRHRPRWRRRRPSLASSISSAAGALAISQTGRNSTTEPHRARGSGKGTNPPSGHPKLTPHRWREASWARHRLDKSARGCIGRAAVLGSAPSPRLSHCRVAIQATRRSTTRRGICQTATRKTPFLTMRTLVTRRLTGPAGLTAPAGDPAPHPSLVWLPPPQRATHAGGRPPLVRVGCRGSVRRFRQRPRRVRRGAGKG